jgi:hypothetical protein
MLIPHQRHHRKRTDGTCGRYPIHDDAQNWRICARAALSVLDCGEANIRRSEIVRADYNMPPVTVRNRDERCRSSNRGFMVSAGVTAGYCCLCQSQASEPPAHTARWGVSGTRPSRCPVWRWKFPGGGDQRPPQERGDQQPVAPLLQQAPGAGDRGIGKHWRNHAGCRNRFHGLRPEFGGSALPAPALTDRTSNDAAGFASCYGPHRRSPLQGS